MHFILTERCNMSCAHCCMAATAQGRDMSLPTFLLGLRLAVEYGEFVCLGGGEPTLHPKWDNILLAAIGVRSEGVLVVTNGSHTERALVLAELCRRDVLRAELSLDDYHGRIDPSVVDAFVRIKAIRNTTEIREPMPYGRALDLVEPDPDPICRCEEWTVYPTGVIRHCGCPDAPIIGHVKRGFNDHSVPRGCYRHPDPEN